MLVLISKLYKMSTEGQRYYKFLFYNLGNYSLEIKDSLEARESDVWGIRENKAIGYFEIPLVDWDNHKIDKGSKFLYTLVAKKYDISDKYRYLVSDPLGNLKFCSYAEVIERIVENGFTNLIRSELCIRAKSGNIPILPTKVSSYQKVLNTNELTIHNEKVFKSFIDNENSSAFELFGDAVAIKRPMGEVALFGDTSKLQERVKKFKKKPFMNDRYCYYCFRTIENANKISDFTNFASYLENSFKGKAFLSYPCMVCEEIQNFYIFSYMGNNVASGCVNSLAPYDMVFNTKGISADIYGLRIMYHEYAHYLSSNKGNSGLVIHRDTYYQEEKYKKIIDVFQKVAGNLSFKTYFCFFMALTEGITEILSGFLYFQDCKKMYKSGKRFINEVENREYSLKEIENEFNPFLSDLRTLKDLTFLFDFDTRNHLKWNDLCSPYLNNILIVLLFAKIIGIDIIIKSYIANDLIAFWDELLDKIGEEKNNKIIKKIL